MPESTVITFTHKEVAEALIKQQNIHEGLWGIYIEFGIAAANIGVGPNDINPAAIIPIVKIGLNKQDELNNITVDAAVVNPLPK